MLAKRIRHAARTACEMERGARRPSQAAIECFRQAHVKAKAQMASLVEERRLGG